MILPSWLSTPETLSVKGAQKESFFVEKNVSKIFEFFSHIASFEKFQRLDGFLQKRNPQAKLFAFLLLIVLSTWLKSGPLLTFMILGSFLLSVISKIPISWFLPCVVGLPALFSLGIALPALFSWITPGTPLISIYPPHLVITEEGFLGVFLFVLRVSAALSCSALLTLTTSWRKLLHAFQMLRVPSLFLFIAEMTYRYIFLFIRLLLQINFARKSRMISTVSLKDEQRWTAERIAFLLKKSSELSENIYAAMLARGYEGKIKSLGREPIDRWDWGLVAFSLGYSLLGIYFSIKG